MDKRQEQLTHLNSYIEGIDKELINILESLPWDQRYLFESKNLVQCEYDSNHRVPQDKKDMHERECFLKSQGYIDDDIILPDPPDNNSRTLVKLGNEDLSRIIDIASSGDPTFKKGTGPKVPEPMTLERLQCAYTADERRAIHDAVVAAAPACHDLSDLALLSTNGEEQLSTKPKSRMEVLAELRNMKRRRAKYRVAAKTRNYSDVLRDVIKTQMEIYTETQNELAPDTNTLENDTKTKNATEDNVHRNYVQNDQHDKSPYKPTHKEKDPPHRNDIHGYKSKEKYIADSRSRYKSTDRNRGDERSRQKLGETSGDVSVNHYNDGSGYKDKEIKYYSRSKAEFRKRSDDRGRYKEERRRSRERVVIKIEEACKSDHKGYGSESGSKYKGRIEEGRGEGYYRERSDYSACDRKNVEVKHRRFYDTFDKDDFNDERRKRKKYN